MGGDVRGLWFSVQGYRQGQVLSATADINIPEFSKHANRKMKRGSDMFDNNRTNAVGLPPLSTPLGSTGQGGGG
jgi:hypothetical protein